jgi:F420-dependent methylenetetrahydromethanopterin dehydrogenase
MLDPNHARTAFLGRAARLFWGVIRLATIGTSTITEKFADAVAQTPGIRIGVVFSARRGARSRVRRSARPTA